MTSSLTDHQHREAALRLALQLPEHRDDALKVLDLLVAITHGFLWEPLPEVQPQQQPQPRVRRVVDFSGRS